MPDLNVGAYKEHADRARQFMPFAALKGYYDLVHQAERVVQPRHELTDEEARELSDTLWQLKKGSMVRVTYYDNDAYVTLQGMVSQVVEALGILCVVRTEIHFEDIRTIEILQLQPLA